ncbi:MAG: SurA N-terminal domain-containing protein, partial [Candidatus Wildermuthbacteria bacterium]|nr:SurA N-terminal domain-containing protein [Candidatus Wildermuthbacteria bacterium]
FIAATVNGSIISRLSVILELEKASGEATLSSLITQKLINDEAGKKGVAISNDEINAEIKKVEEQIMAQGGTLEQALTSQGMTQEEFRKQVVIQKELEKILADKIQITEAEIDQYIKDNKITIPAGQEASYKKQIGEQLQQQKLSSEAKTLIDSLKSQAKNNYFVNY